MNRSTLGLLLAMLLVLGMADSCVPPPPPKPPAPPPLAPPEYRRHVQLAEELEQSGLLVKALEQWKIAQTINPQDQQIAASIARVEKAIAYRAEQAYQTGLEDWNKGLFHAARRNFLIALRLNPHNQQALAKLFQAPVEPKGVLVHRVAPGETLSIIAGKYYGDIRKYRYLADYNKIEDPSRLRVGQKILIPGLKPQPSVPAALPPPSPPSKETKVMEPAAPRPAEPQVLEGKELYYLQAVALYREKDYESAAYEFQKVINVDPNYKDASSLFKESTYLWGRQLLSQENLDQAFMAFRNLALVDPQYRDVLKYLRITEERVKDWHYRKGIQLYEQERLEEALKEWKQVHKLDPNYKKVRFYINRCQQILKKLEELKSSGS